MEPKSLQYIAEACGGRLTSSRPEVLAIGISTDSRLLKPGELFVALRGENFQGHQFLEAAVKAGAGAVLVEESNPPAGFQGCPVILVRDTRRALGLIASRYRAEFIPLVIAVGGSNGKTTTKELIASILRTRWQVIWSEASFNNDVGVPLTLLRLERQHRAAVLEAGTNHPGELSPLLNMIRPRFGIITNIGREHLEFFGTVDGVAREEGSLAEVLSKNGVLFLQGDSPWSDAIAARTRARVVRVGFGLNNDWRAENLRADQTGVRFSVRAPATIWDGEYRVPLIGRHQVANALFALAVAGENHFTKSEMEAGLASCPPPKMRLQLKWIGGVGWLNDAYNSNPDSLRAAIETLSELPCSGRRFAILGEMLELGARSEEAHIEAGQMAAAAHLDGLWTVGRWAAGTAQEAKHGGVEDAIAVADAAEAVECLARVVRPGDLVLLKASRGARLETIEKLWEERRVEDLALH